MIRPPDSTAPLLHHAYPHDGAPSCQTGAENAIMRPVVLVSVRCICAVAPSAFVFAIAAVVMATAAARAADAPPCQTCTVTPPLPTADIVPDGPTEGPAVPPDDPAVQMHPTGCAVWTDRCVTCERDAGKTSCTNIGVACQPQAVECVRSEPAEEKKKQGN
jgi:hypothetical protein